MCGRFALSAKTRDIENLVPGIKIKRDLTPRYNIAPSQKIAALLNDNSRELIYPRWGLVPFWAKDTAIGFSLINARAESLVEKPAFKNAFKKQRCLIFSDGFFEWKKIDGKTKKIPMFIRLKSGKPFAFAGLWDTWKNPDDNSLILSATIVTTTPNRLMEQIHNRMPVILDNSDYDKWLNPGFACEHDLLGCLKQYPESEMDAYEISDRVNNVRFDDELCIQPIN